MADDVHFLRFLIIGGRGEFHQVVWTLDHWSAAIWSLPTNIDASKQCGFKTLQYGSSLLQSTAAHNIAQGGVFVEPVPRLELKRSQMLCNTEHLNCAVQLTSRLYSCFRNSGSAGGEN